MTPDQRAAYDEMVAGPRGGVMGPLARWLYSPVLAQRAQALGVHCRFSSSLSNRRSELAILITARHWRSGFEWNAHAKLARAAGLPESVIEAIGHADTPEFDDPADEVIYVFALELLATQGVSQPVFDRARELLGEVGVVDLIGVLGYYGLVSMTINALRIPPGKEPPFVAV